MFNDVSSLCAARLCISRHVAHVTNDVQVGEKCKLVKFATTMCPCLKSVRCAVAWAFADVTCLHLFTRWQAISAKAGEEERFCDGHLLNF